MSVKHSKDKPIGVSLWNLTFFIFKMMLILFCVILAAIINSAFKIHYIKNILPGSKT